MTGIVFEAYSGATTTNSTGRAALPAFSGYASDTAIVNGAGNGVFRFFGRGNYGTTGKAKLPSFMANASDFGGTIGLGVVPKVRGLAAANSPIPSVTLQIAAAPYINTHATSHSLTHGSGYARLPLCRAIGFDTATTFGEASLPLFGSVSYQAPPLLNYVFALQSAGYISTTSTSGKGRALIDGFTLDAAGRFARLVTVISETLAMSGQFVNLYDQLAIISEQLGFGDDNQAFLRLIITEILHLAAQGDAALSLLLRVVDTLAIHAGPHGAQQAVAFVAAVLALNDAIAQIDKETITSGLGLTATMGLDWIAYAKALDALLLDDVQHNSLLLTALLTETAAFGDGPINIATLLQQLKDCMGMTATVTIDGETYSAWVMNVEGAAFTSYDNFPFNSFGLVYESYFGMAADGLYILEGDDDAGADINARVRWGLQNVGQSKLSRIEMAYLGLSTDGTMGLKAITTSPEGDKIAYYYVMNSRPSNDVRENRIKIGKGLQSVYWGWELTNVTGADFELSDFSLLPMILSRRIRRE